MDLISVVLKMTYFISCKCIIVPKLMGSTIIITFFYRSWILAGLLVIAILCASLLRQRKNLCRFFKQRSGKNLLIEQPD